MHSSKKVIKAASIRIARDQQYETLPKSMTAGYGKRPSRDSIDPAPSAEDHRHRENEERIERFRQKAYEQGMAEGLKRGVAQQKHEIANLANSLSNLISELSKARKEFLSRVERDVLDLAFAIAEKILNHEIATDKEVVRKVLGGALTKIVDHEGMRIRVNPLDYRYLTEGNRDIFPGLEGAKDVILEEDPSIRQGGVLIASAFGEVDARLEQQMRTLRGALAGD